MNTVYLKIVFGSFICATQLCAMAESLKPEVIRVAGGKHGAPALMLSPVATSRYEFRYPSCWTKSERLGSAASNASTVLRPSSTCAEPDSKWSITLIPQGSLQSKPPTSNCGAVSLGEKSMQVCLYKSNNVIRYWFQKNFDGEFFDILFDDENPQYKFDPKDLTRFPESIKQFIFELQIHTVR